MNEPTRYRRPSESSYARGSWWTSHAAELIGAIAGFLVGFVIGAVLQVVAPAVEVGWLPWLTMIVGALGLRWAVGRQFHNRR